MEEHLHDDGAVAIRCVSEWGQKVSTIEIYDTYSKSMVGSVSKYPSLVEPRCGLYHQCRTRYSLCWCGWSMVETLLRSASTFYVPQASINQSLGHHVPASILITPYWFIDCTKEPRKANARSCGISIVVENPKAHRNDIRQGSHSDWDP